MRILHAADFHLDGAYGHHGRPNSEQDRMVEDQREVFRQFVDLAISLEPDAVLIAGDLFDAEYLSTKTITLLVDELGQIGCTVLVAPGNHDPYWSYLGYNWPNNVLIFSDHWDRVKTGDGLIWGFGHNDNNSSENWLRTLPKFDPKTTNVILYHGSLIGRGDREPDFAPFSIDDVLSTPADYIAMGHYHGAVELTDRNGIIVGYYPGAPRGLNSGWRRQRGVVFADVGKAGTTVTPYFGGHHGFEQGQNFDLSIRPKRRW